MLTFTSNHMPDESTGQNMAHETCLKAERGCVARKVLPGRRHLPAQSEKASIHRMYPITKFLKMESRFPKKHRRVNVHREWLFDVLACVVRRWRGSWVNERGWMEVGPRSYLHRWNALGS